MGCLANISWGCSCYLGLVLCYSRSSTVIYLYDGSHLHDCVSWFCILRVPGIYLALAYALIAPVFIFEGLTLRSAMSRSRQLVSGTLWANLRCVVTLYTGHLSITYDCILPRRTRVSPTCRRRTSLHCLLIIPDTTNIWACLVWPVAQIATVLLYFDIRVRKEGLDVALLAQSLDQPAPISADTGGVM